MLKAKSHLLWFILMPNLLVGFFSNKKSYEWFRDKSVLMFLVCVALIKTGTLKWLNQTPWFVMGQYLKTLSKWLLHSFSFFCVNFEIFWVTDLQYHCYNKRYWTCNLFSNSFWSLQWITERSKRQTPDMSWLIRIISVNEKFHQTAPDVFPFPSSSSSQDPI